MPPLPTPSAVVRFSVPPLMVDSAFRTPEMVVEPVTARAVVVAPAEMLRAVNCEVEEAKIPLVKSTTDEVAAASVLKSLLFHTNGACPPLRSSWCS